MERNAREITNVEERAEKAWHIINQLCLNGHTREAWELIEGESGSVRQKGLGGFFRDADLPKEEILTLLNSLKTADRSSALYNYWSRFSPEEFVTLDMKEFPLASGFETGGFRRLIGDMLTDTLEKLGPEASRNIRADILAKVAEQANARSFHYGELSAIIEKDPSKDGFLYWEAVKSIDPEVKANQPTFDGPDAQIVRLMAAQDPERLIGMATTPGNPATAYYHIALMEWLNRDYKNADQWYDRNFQNLSDRDKDLSAVAFARANVRAGNLEAGEQWINLIQSEKYKNSVSYERNEIARKKSTTPGQ